MKEELIKALTKRFPAMKPNMADRYAGKYMAAVMTEIATQYMLMNSDDMTGEMNFAADRVNVASKRAIIDSKSIYIYSMMQSCPSTSLVVETYTGNSLTHRVSKVMFNPKYKKVIMEELRSMTIELNPQYLQDLDDKANNSVAVDVETLGSYIEHTRQALINPPSQAYADKLLRNLLVANQLLAQVKEQDGEHWVDEYWEQIDSGRIQGHGISLQRISKEVRHAALGRCHRYDFKAASYALMTSLALQLDPTLNVAVLRDYIKNRTSIRKRIAKDIGISEDWMKSIFTSLGFGAELKDNPFNSIRGMLGQVKYHKLICNFEFLAIKRQLDQVSNTIHKHSAFPDTGFVLHGRTYTHINPKDGKKRTKNQKLAWIYQCLESHALGLFVDMVPEECNVKLMVHDCLYLQTPLSSQHFADIHWKLSQAYPLLTFEHDAIVPIHAEGFIGRAEREMLQRKQDHKLFILQQSFQADKSVAQGYVPVGSTVSAAPIVVATTQVSESDEEYEVRRRAQFDADIIRGLSDDAVAEQKEYHEKSYFKDKY